MAIKKIFFDANIFNDIFDRNRPAYAESYLAYTGSLAKGMTIYTSCDIATNVYYITAKYRTREEALDAIELLKESVSVIPFGEEELTQTITLKREDPDYKDLEDTIQYIMALNTGCDVIVSNDKRFVSKEIEMMDSQTFVKRFL